MNDTLMALRAAALQHPELRTALLATQQHAEPLNEFCSIAASNGFPIFPEDIIADGEAYSSLQTKSTNGGNPLPYECFDDEYEMFLISIR